MVKERRGAADTGRERCRTCDVGDGAVPEVHEVIDCEPDAGLVVADDGRNRRAGGLSIDQHHGRPRGVGLVFERAAELRRRQDQPVDSPVEQGAHDGFGVLAVVVGVADEQ